MRLNQRTKARFQKRVNKSKAEIWRLVETNKQKFRWTEFVKGSPINYGQFTLQDDSIQVLRRPDFLGFITPTGRIKFTMDEDNQTLVWEVNPLDADSILPIGLLLAACGIIEWTTFVILLTSNIKVLAIVLSTSWAATLLTIYLTYALYKSDLVSYGHRIAKELTGD